MKLFSLLLTFITLNSYANDCAKDAKNFCASIDPGKGQLAKCLEDYSSRLSPACAKELKEYKVKTAKKNPCFEDLADLCEDIPAEARSLEYCLLKNESRLSETCSADFKKKKGNIIVKNVCAQDVANHCYTEVSGPDGAITRCLIRNKAKLSTFCQKNIDQKITKMRKNNPCFDETEKYCPTQVKFADIQECLEKKISVVNPNCKKIVQIEMDKAQANPCYRDLTRHCKPRLSPQEQHRCLSINENELSNSCRQFRAKEDQKVKKMVDSCEQDRLKFCPKAPFKDGMVAKCLKQNKAKISKKCAELI